MSTFFTIIPVTLSWLGLVAYALKMYYTLSGYADIAIGLGKILGFRVSENFDYPYTARSLTMFWEKWHMTMIAWFRRYIERPLGVRRANKALTNGFLLWVLIGVWHGAEVGILLWAIWNFIFLSIENIVNFDRIRIPAIGKHIYFLLVLLLGLVFFGSDSLYHAFQYLGNLFGMRHNGFFSETAMMFARENWLVLLLGMLFATPITQRFKNIVTERNVPGLLQGMLVFCYFAAYLLIAAISVIYIVGGRNVAFIF
jgi:D-alanyl-lipoteichoic acid acyltransferase DltB (MBOAT superfamily)